MDDDQQFCLRWNNHQSTLVSVFDTLLEKGIHVDCTLAAEGRTLRAHKVVLSACSPYFESVLSQQYDKHPIIILKDVKFAELRAMMDYMYRGEVNISQDQLGALLKAAESLQIKGLSDNKPPPPPSPAMSPPPKTPSARASPCIESEHQSREGSVSPRRKRRKTRSSPSPTAEVTRESPTIMNNTLENNFDEHKIQTQENTEIPVIPNKTENNYNSNIETKPEFSEESNYESVEDLTVEEEPDSETEQTPATSTQLVGDGSAQGFSWPMDRSQEEMNISNDGRDNQGLAALEMTPLITQLQLSNIAQFSPDSSLTPIKTKLIQDALTQNNNIITKEELDCKTFPPKCEVDSEGEIYDFDDILLPDESEVYGSAYSVDSNEDECTTVTRMGRRAASSEPPPQFVCRHCGKRYRWKSTLRRHESVECGGKPPAHACPHCPYRAKQRGNLGVHIRKHHHAQWSAFADTKLRKAKKENQSVKY